VITPNIITGCLKNVKRYFLLNKGEVRGLLFDFPKIESPVEIQFPPENVI
jgi:hypothetical protein